MTSLALILAATITAQPLTNADVLEPSVRNEVDHALSVMPTNSVAVSEAAVAFAALFATNGLNATERAIALISSQKQGRWFWQGAEVTPVAARLLRRAADLPEPPLRLAIFSSHVEQIARQENLSLAAAAQKVKALGYSGVSEMEGLSPASADTLRKAGLATACVIGFTNFERHYDERQCANLIARARAADCRQIMLVPGFYPDTTNHAETLRTIVARTNRFAAEASRHGIETIIEDFDNETSPTCGIGRLTEFLSAAPSVGFTYDTGNFSGTGGKPTDGMALLGRLRHLHLKDRPAADSAKTVAVGAGIVPMSQIITAVRDVGYDGWFTVELFGVTNMLRCAEASAAFLKSGQF